MMVKLFHEIILDWFDLNGRKNLPWQKTITPYRVWVSEIMLQQTQVQTVIPYFERFMQCYPSLQMLAQAKEEDVLKLWAGLGYYSRARNLHCTAVMLDRRGGEFPSSVEELSALPGIGRSTAGAILSIAMGQPQPILDGNVKRVLTRFFAITGYPGDPAVQNRLWQLSTEVLPKVRSADYTQAIMDLGATVCTRTKPKCDACPVSVNCMALKAGIVDQLPESKPKKTLEVRSVFFLILQDSRQRVLLERRQKPGVWRGLWSLPEFNGFDSLEEWCQINLGDFHATPLPSQRHTFSHYHLDFVPVLVCAKKGDTSGIKNEHWNWHESDHLLVLGLPAPIKKLLVKIIAGEL